MFNNWYVDEKHQYYYGDSLAKIIEENDLDENYKFVPREDWTAEDYAEIFGNELEDRNRHAFVEMPNWLLEICNQILLSDKQKAALMKAFAEKVLSEV